MNATTASPPADFKLQLEFAAPAGRVFTALATGEGARGWWTWDCAVSEGVDGLSAFRFPGSGFFATMKTLRREPPRLLEWECVDSQHNPDTGYADLRDWVGTTIRFEIHDLGGGKSRLDFNHSRLHQLECHTVCISGWKFFLDESLRGYVEQGKGRPWDGKG